MKTIRVGKEKEISILDQCCLHELSSHEQDRSKYLDDEQMISLTKAAFTVQNLSCAVNSACNSQEHAIAQQSKQDHWCGA
jgi:hypothetical protein